MLFPHPLILQYFETFQNQKQLIDPKFNLNNHFIEKHNISLNKLQISI